MITARAARGPATSFVLTRSPDVIAAHLEDAAHFPGGHADVFARPASEQDVAALLTSSSVVLPIGAQSSLTGGATPHGGVIISSERFTAIEPVDENHVRVGAGVPLLVLQEALAHAHRWYPPVPTFTGACVGGVIATNAAGAATFKYGATRQWVDGLTLVMACGCVLDLIRGDAITDRSTGWTLACAHGTRHIAPASYDMPAVAKCSAGDFAAASMDLIDLFIGSEGTLGVITAAVLRTRPAPPAFAMALITMTSEAAALALTSDLRDASQQTWQSGDARGIDVSAIEHMDRRCIDIVCEDGADRRNAVTLPADSQVVLFVHLELRRGSSATTLFGEVARALGAGAIDTPIARLCRLLDRHGVLERTELAMPGDTQRLNQFLALREAAPTGVNRRVGDAKRNVDPRIEKTAADMIVPFGRLAEMMHIYREGSRRRGLDFAIWGHISDGNLHPNVLPRSYADIAAGKEAILTFGREAARLGGCPLAEHGVGRNPVKQQLLLDMYGAAGIADMRAIKRVLDPDGRLAPGVLFP